MLRVSNFQAMGFFNRIFGGDSKKPLPLEEVRALAGPLAAAAVHLVPASGVTSSYFRGEPLLPAGVSWPAKNGKRLAFLASIDLASVAEVVSFDWLPRDGRLLFFYDIDGQPWGFDPKDRGSWAVIHDAGVAASPPLSSEAPLQFVSPQLIASLPRTYPRPRSYERPEISALELTDEQSDALIEITDSIYGDGPRHQIGGFPSAVQGDAMELECQLASNGIYAGEPAGYETPQAKALEAGATEWRLLFQVDGDDALNLMWGDCGIIYFWIREEDARARRFDKAWLVLQCH
jgi:uncharacterized protein YwqG